MNVTLTRHRMRLSNSRANREVNSKLWKPLTGKQSANARWWFLVAVIVLSSVVGILRSYFG